MGMFRGKDRMGTGCPGRTRGLALLFMAVALCALTVLIAPAVQAAVAKPVVLTGTINDYTTSVQVYAAKGTLTVKNGKKTVATKKYTSAGVKTITIKKQTAGSTLSFTLKNSSGKSSPAVKKTVEELTSVKESSSVKKPTVSTKTITSATTKIKIKGYNPKSEL